MEPPHEVFVRPAHDLLPSPGAALITGMDQPLGRAVGNSLEIIESIESLKGRGPADVMEVTFALGCGQTTGSRASCARTGTRPSWASWASRPR